LLEDRARALDDGARTCDIRCMHEDRCVQPRQIYASTVTRRDRRWTRRRGRHPFGIAVLTGMALGAALTVLAVFAPGLT
jgi:hypothetical protein